MAAQWMNRRATLAAGAVAALVLGAAGGAYAEAMTGPRVEMAPAAAVPIASLAQRQGIVTVRGKVAEVYGDRFVVADGSGRAMVDAGRRGTQLQSGAPVTVQGRYDNGQLRASFMVDRDGTVEAVGPAGPHGHHDGPPPPPPGGPGAPPPPPGGPGAPPPPAGCGPAGGAGVAPPPPANGAVPLPPVPAPTGAVSQPK